jgi:hypothetical protein
VWSNGAQWRYCEVTPWDKTVLNPLQDAPLAVQLIVVSVFASLLLLAGAASLTTALQAVDHESNVIGAERELLKLTIRQFADIRDQLISCTTLSTALACGDGTSISPP